MKSTLLSLVALLLISASTFAQYTSIKTKVQNMQRHDGYFPFYWDEVKGKIWLEIDKLDTEFLYVNSLPAGVGSNDIGLDRGQMGDNKVVEFRRVGPKVLLVHLNYSYRAESKNADERKAVKEAFAESVLWGFDVVATDKEKVLVDASYFFLQDVHNVTGTLKSTKQGSYNLDKTRSAFYLSRTKNFPKNTEVEVTLTFKGKPAGGYIRSVTPSPEAVTVRQHHSFVELPDANYEKRVSMSGCGFGGITYSDYATPINQSLKRSYILRHRLKKKNPKATSSEAIDPIVYYLDRGAPEPIRSALLEGAGWWNQAFEAIGYKNAFVVKMLPEDADPMDLRYNLIQWVHRATRGWSYGASIIDPRTGEIIKGHVSLGSLRVRQDFLIAEGLLAPYKDGSKISEEMEKMALARLRQLSAHEVGHTLGLSHNFAASTNKRASVMDYPQPLVKLTKDGKFDLSDAYDVGIGNWDKVAISYGYQDFPQGTDEMKTLKETLSKAWTLGYRFMSDRDARSEGSVHPYAHLWDNGGEAVLEIEHMMKVREIALKNFSENVLRKGDPMTKMEENLVPIYLYHRYQIQGVAKLIAGVDYTYATRGDGQVVNEIVDPTKQDLAIEAMLKTLEPNFLILPEELLRKISPQPSGWNRETFKGRTGLPFDPLMAAENSASLTLRLLLNPERVSRLVEYHARNNKYPGLGQVVDQLMKTAWNDRNASSYHQEIGRVVDKLVLHYLMEVVVSSSTSEQAKAIVLLKLNDLKSKLETRKKATKDESQKAHYHYGIDKIESFEITTAVNPVDGPKDLPPGSPIGVEFGCGFQH
jgi:hypothetical protein